MVDFEYKPEYNLEDFRKIITLLRSPGGCPWDIEQTHESIRRNLLEEAYEACEAIDSGDSEHLKEELGDLMMQVFFHSSIEEEKGSFNVDDVADAACKKLIFRHPHVFGDTNVSGASDVLVNWEELKRKEKAQSTVTKSLADVAESLPALWRAEKIQKKAKKTGFDWPDVSGAVDKLYEEISEYKRASEIKDINRLEDELGDVLFSVVNIARFEGVDPEKALHRSCEKFIKRFAAIEKAAEEQGRDISSMTLGEMEEVYQSSKKEEVSGN